MSLRRLALSMAVVLCLQPVAAEPPVLIEKLSRSGIRGADEHFGLDVAIWDGCILAGVHGWEDGLGFGGACVFVPSDGAWREISFRPEPILGFGRPISAQGRLAVVGSTAHPLRILEFDGDAAAVVAEIEIVRGFQNAVGSVAIDGNRCVIGASHNDANGPRAGAAFVFDRNEVSGAWSRSARLLASDGAAVDLFGSSIAIDGDLLVVGAPEDDPLGFASGSAYVFEADNNGVWAEVAKLVPSNGASFQSFGAAVAISEGQLLIGAPLDSVDGVFSGAVYIFELDDQGRWGEVGRLVPSDQETAGGFGDAVAIDGPTALIGSPFHNGAADSAGAAYLFSRAEGAWFEAARIAPDDLCAFDKFGYSVAVKGGLAVVGAPFQPGSGPDGEAVAEAGAAYVYRISDCVCDADADGDLFVGQGDLSCVLQNFGRSAVGCQAGDLNGDNKVDLHDLASILAAYGYPCGF